MQASLEPTAADDEFALSVPPIRFLVPGLPLTVSPFLLATVTSECDRVLISSDACTLTGTPAGLVDSLNERFDFRVRTAFTWKVVPPERAAILSTTNIEVDVDTPRLFALVPLALLEAIAGGAMRVVLDALQGEFLRNLASDYERWATDAEYRASRASPPPRSAGAPSAPTDRARPRPGD